MPIWHEIGYQDVLQFSPPLADIKALNSSDGIPEMVRQISDLIPQSVRSQDSTIEEAQEMLDRGDCDLACKTAFVAFDRRVIGIADSLRDQGVLESDFRIPQYPCAAWEAILHLRRHDSFTLPTSVDLDFLHRIMEKTVGGWSYALQAPPSPEDSAAVVSQVAAILRANPLIYCPKVE